MNTKIIYISGSEVFDMCEIRAAFEEVRSALGLDKNTVLFGVPVDSDNALSVEPNQFTTQNTTAQAPEIIDFEPENTQSNDTFINETPQTSEINIEVADSDEIIDEMPQTVETVEVPTTEQESSQVESEAPIPILSVLAAKEPVDPISEDDTVAEYPAEIIAEEHEEIITEIVDDIAETENQVPETQIVSIDDIVDDEEPVTPMEKTLEQLLESMTPLREDHDTHHVEDPAEEPEEEIINFEEDSADATLAQLATEFAETEDKIPTTPKAENHGKIGKLKNILPFKKLKRDDNGIMGDLFGWAGIAANDDDFSIPGFFTNAAGKK